MAEFNPDKFLGKDNPKKSFDADSFLETVDKPAQAQDVGTFDRGGWVDRNVLSGQIPAMTSGMASVLSGKNPVTSPIPVGLAGAAGERIQKLGRVISGIDQPETVGGAFQQTGKDFTRHAAYEAAGGSAGKIIGNTIGTIKSGIQNRTIPRYLRGLWEGNITGIGQGTKMMREGAEATAREAHAVGQSTAREASRVAEQQSRDAHRVAQAAKRALGQETKDAARTAIKDFPEVIGHRGIRGAGPALKETSDQITSNLTKNIDAALDATVRRYESAVISPEPLRKHMMGVLKNHGILDESGNILRDQVGKIRIPKTRQMIKNVIGYSDDLVANPTVKEANKIVRELKRLSNFRAIERTAEEMTYGPLSRTIKEALYEGLEGVASSADVAALKLARKKFADTRPIFKMVESLTKGTPEQIIERSRTLLRGSVIDDIVTKVPALRPAIEDVVMNDVVRNVKTADGFTAVINRYGRNALKKLMDKKTYSALMQIEKNFASASKRVATEPFKQGRGFVATPFPKERLGSVWKKALSMAERGEWLAPQKWRVLIQQMAQIPSQSENKSSKKWGPI